MGWGNYYGLHSKKETKENFCRAELNQSQISSNFLKLIFLSSILVALLGGLGIQFVAAENFVNSWGSEGRDSGKFNQPWEIAVDSQNNLYVIDINNDRVQKFTSAGEFILSWGGFGGKDGKFSNPHGIIVDSQDNVYVSDNADRIQKFTSAGEFILSWGTEGVAEGEFDEPHALAVDSFDNVYVTDNNDRVQKFTSAGEFILSWGKNGLEEGSFMRPMGIAIDSKDNVYVADVNNHRIQKFSSDGEFISVWIGTGIIKDQLQFPNDIFIDSADNVYITDTGNHQIKLFTIDGKLVKTWGEAGRDAGQFLAPVSVVVNSLGDVYAVDHNNNRVQHFTLEFDTISPEILVPSNIIVETKSDSGSIVTFDVSATDETGVIGVPTCDYQPTALFPVGETLVTCTASDAAGNEGIGTFRIIVNLLEIDRISPQVIVPSDMTIETEVKSGLSIDFEVSATDETGVIGVPTCDYQPNTNFPVGETLVTCTASDAAGNEGTNSFKVNVAFVVIEPLAKPKPDLIENEDNTTTIAAVGVGVAAAAGAGAIIASKAGVLGGAKAASAAKAVTAVPTGSEGSVSGPSGVESQSAVSQDQPIHEIEHGTEGEEGGIQTPDVEVEVRFGFE